MVEMALPSAGAHGAAHGGGEAPAKMHVSYDAVHASCWQSFPQLQQSGFGQPDMLIAISGGGLIPARILRGVLRNASNNGGCAQIKVIGLELYDDEVQGRERETGVIRTQWLELGSTSLIGKRILLVDEVDDSRQTLAYAVRELQADIAAQAAALTAAGEAVPTTQLGVYVLHNKQRPKKGTLPEGVPQFVAQEVKGNPWICYPWDAVDIEAHNRLAACCARRQLGSAGLEHATSSGSSEEEEAAAVVGGGSSSSGEEEMVVLDGPTAACVAAVAAVGAERLPFGSHFGGVARA